jgi:hypothetical protein
LFGGNFDRHKNTGVAPHIGSVEHKIVKPATGGRMIESG